MKRSTGRSWKIKRNARLPRHSNSLLPNLRMPSPLWACGRPKPSASSHKASKHSTRSALGNSRRRFSTLGSMESSLADHFPELFSRDGDEFSRSLECPVTFVRGFFEGCQLLCRRSVFALCVILDSTSTLRRAIMSASQTIPTSSPREAAANHRPKFFLASVFSPTDALLLTHRTKMLMMIESTISLLTMVNRPVTCYQC